LKADSIFGPVHTRRRRAGCYPAGGVQLAAAGSQLRCHAVKVFWQASKLRKTVTRFKTRFSLASNTKASTIRLRRNFR